MSEFTSKHYQDYLAEGRIRGSRCDRCGSIYLPPRPVCPDCGSTDLQWTDLSGAGVVQSFTVVHVPLSSMVGRAPYAVAVVALDDGPSITGRVLDVVDDGRFSVGSRVEAEFLAEGEETLLCFKLA